jgi:hypothetical protein
VATAWAALVPSTSPHALASMFACVVSIDVSIDLLPLRLWRLARRASRPTLDILISHHT